MERRWAVLFALALAVSGCTPWDKYAAGQNQKYYGISLFNMYEEWGTPIDRVHLLNGQSLYRFRKSGTDCKASAWTNDLDIIFRVNVTGPETCTGP